MDPRSPQHPADGQTDVQLHYEMWRRAYHQWLREVSCMLSPFSIQAGEWKDSFTRRSCSPELNTGSKTSSDRPVFAEQTERVPWLRSVVQFYFHFVLLWNSSQHLAYQAHLHSQCMEFYLCSASPFAWAQSHCHLRLCSPSHRRL